MDYKEKYEDWMESEVIDKESKNELRSLSDDEIKDRFYQNLSFGTAGLRGIIGAGTNRMNIYTVGLATQAFAEYILSCRDEAIKKEVAICYDVRYMSKTFAELTSCIFAANGIKVKLFKDIAPTPLLSWAIRYYKTTAGVMITASHNPREYNGYKAYWDDGSQILEEIAGSIEDNIRKLDTFDKIKKVDFNKACREGMIDYVDEECIESYYRDLLAYAINEDIDKEIKVVYTPLNGTGNKPVREVLYRRGFKNVFVVEEQENPDPDFTTVGYPNPEDPKAFKLAEDKAKKVGADLIIATDPDSDRTAIEVFDGNDFVFLNGNQTGALLTNYILSELTKSNNFSKIPVIVKSIVTGDLSIEIAKKYGAEVREVLTGFKNIAEVANELEESNTHKFIFGFEESIGYTYGDSVRDKDAVNSSMMITEMAAFYKKRGKTLIDVLNELYKEYGYYNQTLVSLTLKGLDGKEKIIRIMEDFRKKPIDKIGELKMEKNVDFEFDQTGLTKSNVLKYYFGDKSWLAIRPSGTEPKIKLYIYTVGKNKGQSEEKIELIKNYCENRISSVK